MRWSRILLIGTGSVIPAIRYANCIADCCTVSLRYRGQTVVAERGLGVATVRRRRVSSRRRVIRGTGPRRGINLVATPRPSIPRNLPHNMAAYLLSTASTS